MVKDRDIREFEAVVTEKEKQIAALLDDNERMASLIHRDNKLLPALSEAVMFCIESNSSTVDDYRIILRQVTQLREARAEILKRSFYENEIIKTGDPVLSGMLAHMKKKASEDGIHVEIAEVSDFHETAELPISKTQLQTVFADLIENAINATACSDAKSVRISLNIDDGIYKLQVMDSGISFMAETLLELGIKKTTTRLNVGGSGVGYMTVFDILRKCNASLIITEFEEGKIMFTKSITVSFDNKAEYLLITYRAGEIKSMCSNRLKSDYPLTVYDS